MTNWPVAYFGSKIHRVRIAATLQKMLQQNTLLCASAL